MPRNVEYQSLASRLQHVQQQRAPVGATIEIRYVRIGCACQHTQSACVAREIGIDGNLIEFAHYAQCFEQTAFWLHVQVLRQGSELHVEIYDQSFLPSD